MATKVIANKLSTGKTTYQVVDDNGKSYGIFEYKNVADNLSNRLNKNSSVIKDKYKYKNTTLKLKL